MIILGKNNSAYKITLAVEDRSLFWEHWRVLIQKNLNNL